MGTAQRSYNHPFQPYEVQVQFMNAVYECLEQGKIGILESPTGYSLTWLREHQRRQILGNEEGNAEDNDEPEWMIQHAHEQKRRTAIQNIRDLERRFAKIRDKEEKARRRYEVGEPLLKRQRTHGGPGGSAEDDDKEEEEEEEAAFILDDYNSDDTNTDTSNARRLDNGLSSETNALMEKLGLSVPNVQSSSKADEEDQEDTLKIFYCSRTHSQLTQFVSELKRVKLPSSVPDEVLGVSENNDRPAQLAEGLKHVTLGSRKNLCINPKVSRLGSVTSINERCLELQQSKTPSEKKCPYLPSKEKEVLVNDFRDHALAQIRDIEDFGKLGKKIGVCPYYAARAAIKSAEIVTLPYPLLLQKSARESLNLSLRGHVVIIDEAHNLMDAISNVHSVTITLEHLEQAKQQIVIYLQKFRNRLKGKNRIYVTQLVRIIDSLRSYLASKAGVGRNAQQLLQTSELISGKGTDQVNLFKLINYLRESKLARKVDGYVELDALKQAKDQNAKLVQEALRKKPAVPALTHIQNFLLALTNPAVEGRFFLSTEHISEDGSSSGSLALKYLLLDPSNHFMDVAQEARALILAGGTMSPLNEYVNYLFHYMPNNKIHTLSCGHVIPPSNLLAIAVSEGPDGQRFEFTFENRQSEVLMCTLGKFVLQYASVIPDGLVVFFPSYTYLNSVMQVWGNSSKSKLADGTILESISLIKKVFIEPGSKRAVYRENTGDPSKVNTPLESVEQVLQAYSKQVESGHGAIMFAVIGGSLSEGINFSDGLGRGVMVVGLPFPNANSPEWKERLAFVRQRNSHDSPTVGAGMQAAQDFYENACMRAVNQSIGRALRHQGDYATILLLDCRYSRPRIQSKLPGWIRSSLKTQGDDLLYVKNFFAAHGHRQAA